jgi:hypothetical protein
LLGEKTVEALPAILLPDRQRLRGFGHGASLVGRVATRQSEPWWGGELGTSAQTPVLARGRPVRCSARLRLTASGTGRNSVGPSSFCRPGLE